MANCSSRDLNRNNIGFRTKTFINIELSGSQYLELTRAHKATNVAWLVAEVVYV